MADDGVDAGCIVALVCICRPVTVLVQDACLPAFMSASSDKERGVLNPGPHGRH
jgi:hypothetical protein